MAENSKIEWTHHTFNPWIGCTKVGPGCDHCYAEALMDTRYGRVNWGPGNPRSRTSDANWRKPLAWNKRCEKLGIRERVFCASLADVFDNEVPKHWRWDLFRLIRRTPSLDWLLLTKRIGNVQEMLNDAADATFEDFVGAHSWDRDPWPNVWIGATVVNQAEADRDIPKLLALNAPVRFLSIEPLLGPIDFYATSATMPNEGHPWRNGPILQGIDWVIVGGESGPGARPMHPQWARGIRDQCLAAGVPFLFKQWGGWQIASAKNGHFGSVMPDTGDRYTWVGRNGRTYNPSAPADQDCWAMAKVGKARAGRMLDGRTWDQVPEVAG